MDSKDVVLTKDDIEYVCGRYEDRYKSYGYSPKTLDWDKGKQDMRFSILTSQCDLRGKAILDIGCGFGDLNRVLKDVTGGVYSYYGIDVVSSLVSEATKRYGSDDVQFACGDYLAMEIPEFDFAIASGIFNLKFPGVDNYQFIKRVMAKTFDKCRLGLAFDFLSDKVDFCKENTFHSSPSRIIEMAYGFSRNIVLLNNYMPFEFSLFVFKDDSFDPACTIFNQWMEENSDAST